MHAPRTLRLLLIVGLLLAVAIPGSLALARTNAAPDQAPLPTQAEPPKAIELIPQDDVDEGKTPDGVYGSQFAPYQPLDQAFQAEVEPNNTAATATALASNDGVVWGAVFPNGDLDYFSFTANAGDRIYAAVMTSFSSNGSTDSVLTLFASDGTTVVETDDNDGSLGSSSSTIAGANIVSGGAYFLQVKHFSATNHLRPYHLHVRVQSGSPTAEVEPNDTPGTANALPAFGWMTGTTSSATDADWFSLALNAGDTIYASLDLDPTRDNTQWNGSLGIGLFSNYYLTVNDASVGSATNPLSEAHFMTVRQTGTYYIWVGVPAGGTTFGDYNLSVSVHPAAPETCTTYTSTDVPQTLGPGATTASSTITVPGNPRIADLNVTVELTHTVMTELDATLMAPGGNEVGLFTDVGQSTAGVFVTMTTTLDDEAAIPIAVYLLQPGPAFEPENVYRLDWFDGQDAGGAWTLKLTDDTANTNGGTLLGWSMRVCEPTPPPVCPGGTTPVTVYSSDFEATDGGFTHSGTADTWAWGSPTAAPINTCNGGVNCWKTNLTGTYTASSTQDLVSPNISLAGLVGPVVVTWSQKYQIESASYDHAYVDFREVGGANPSRLWEWYGATMTTGVGAVTVQESAGWGTRQRDLSSYAGQNTELVFHLDGDSSIQYAGLAVDDVSVTACQPAGATFTPTVTPTVTPTPTDTPTPTNTPTATPVPAGFTCSTPNVAIPDNNPTGVSDTLNVGSTGTLNDVNVFVRATHTWVGDTSFSVTHNATSVTVVDRPGVPASTFGCSGDNITATLDDEAATPVEDECAASVPTINGTFIPNNALSAFDGMDQSGAWTITAVDAAGGDTGVLVEWCVQTETSVPPTATPTDTATPEPATATPTDTATPEPATATPTNTSVPPTPTPTNTPTAIVGVIPPAPPVCTASTLDFTNNTPVTIASTAATVVSSTLTVVGAAPYLWDINLTTNISHTNNGNLDITLQSPQGTIVTLSTDNGGTNDNGFAGTVWDDDANPGGQVPYVNNNGLVNDQLYVNLVTASPLVIEEAFGAFIGEDPNGVWTLTISDDASVDGGSLNSWTLQVTSLNAAPSTASAASSNSTPVAITATGTPVVTSSIMVSGLPTFLTDLNMTTFISHTFNGDLDMTLRSPQGTIVTFSSDNGSSFDHVFLGTLWDDDANPGGQVPYTNNNGLVTDQLYVNLTLASPLVPEEAFAAFIGEDPNGEWLVTISDDANLDGGSLNSWSLDIQTGSCGAVPTATPTATSAPPTATPTDTPVPPTATVTPTATPTPGSPTGVELSSLDSGSAPSPVSAWPLMALALVTLTAAAALLRRRSTR